MGINLKRENKSWTLDDVITKLNETSTAKDFAESMQNIDEKLNTIKKEITYWDVYNISSAITSPEAFDNKIANLEINNSVVINTTYFKRNFQGIETEFHSGDVIIRLKDGAYQHIKSANTGVYVPTLTRSADETQITITYNYETTPPLGDTDENTDSHGYKKYFTNITPLSGDNSKMYGYSISGIYDSDSDGHYFPFKVVYQNEVQYQSDYKVNLEESKPIIPVLKFFDKNNQEVYTDEYTLYLEHKKNADDDYYSCWYRFYLHNNSSGLIQKVVIK